MTQRLDVFVRNGLRFDVHDTGPADGTPVVLLHGFPQDHSAYHDVARRLAAHGLRVLVPDQRGYSPGARPRRRRDYAMGELVDDVVALLDQTGVRRAHVVGHDWGGAVAWAFAGRRAERVLSLTALSTPHPAAMQEAFRHSDQLRRSRYMLWYQVPWLPERALLANGGARIRDALLRSGLPNAHAERYTNRLLERGALSAALSWYRGIPASRGFAAGRVRVPTVYLYGRDDPFFARFGFEATERFVAAPFRAVPLDAGHWLPETEPAQVADAVVSQLG